MVKIAAPPVRRIELDGAENCRDIGGSPTLSGMRVRRGCVYRSEALNKLSPGDIRRLHDLGLHTVVDLRSDEEIGADGADVLPAGVALEHDAVAAGDLGSFNAVVMSADPERQRAELGGGKLTEWMLGTYRTFVTDQALRLRFGAALAAIADSGKRPLLYHCTAGKDRTGWLTAVLLSLLGVSRELIMYDYLLSNQFHRGTYAEMLRDLQASGRMQEPELLRPLLEQSPDYLQAAFDAVDRRYAGISAYVRTGLGLDEGAILALRQGLLEPDPEQLA